MPSRSKMAAVVGHRPEAHHQRFGTGDLEGSSKAEDS